MKPITFSGAGKLAGLAAMLDCYGHATDDQTIARGMEAPYLILHEHGQYKAGSVLYRPRWLNLYLHPHGFHMDEERCPAAEVPSRLRDLPTAMLPLKIDKGCSHPVVYTGYAAGRFRIENIKRADSTEPDAISMTSAMLKRRLDGEITLYTLKQHPPEEVNFIPLLLNSLNVLKSYRTDLLEARKKHVTRDELQALHAPLFRALMQNLHPLAAIVDDLWLAEELRLLNHDYRHIFTRNSPSTVLLSDRLPGVAITQCIAWLYENIVDRIYALGADDELMASRLSPFE